MAKYIYWDNSKKWHGRKILEIEVSNMHDADLAFAQLEGFDPKKVGSIGCQLILPESNENSHV